MSFNKHDSLTPLIGPTAWVVWTTKLTLECVSHKKYFNFYIDTEGPSGAGSSQYQDFTITLRHTTLGRTPLDEWSAATPRPLIDNTQHSQQTNIHASAGSEPAIPASERPQTHALDRATTGNGKYFNVAERNFQIFKNPRLQFVA